MSSTGSKKRFNPIHLEDAAVDLLNHVVKMQEKMGWISLLLPLIFIAWAIHRWLFSFSNWLSLALALWASMQVGYSSLSFFILFNHCFEFHKCFFFPCSNVSHSFPFELLNQAFQN